MEISGPQNNLRINDNPDNWDIKKEMDAINKPTPGWVKIVRAKPDDKLQLALAQARNDPEYEKEGLRIEIEELQRRINILEKRWKALRKDLNTRKKEGGLGMGYWTIALLIMNKITRKLK